MTTHSDTMRALRDHPNGAAISRRVALAALTRARFALSIEHFTEKALGDFDADYLAMRWCIGALHPLDRAAEEQRQIDDVNAI